MRVIMDPTEKEEIEKKITDAKKIIEEAETKKKLTIDEYGTVETKIETRFGQDSNKIISSLIKEYKHA